MTKHKWHDEIVAWAGGAEIEYSTGQGWNIAAPPIWEINGIVYRIKQQPSAPKYLYAYHRRDGSIDLSPMGGNCKATNYIGKIEVQS